MTVAVLNALLRPLVEGRLPDWLDARWYSTKDEAMELAPAAEIGWFDFHDRNVARLAIERAEQMKWLNSITAGIERLPLDLLRKRGVILTNGAGISAIPIAEYTVMLMLTQAKGYREVMRAQDRHEWLKDSPGKRELFGSKALILGYGGIGQEIEARLLPFQVEVTKVRRNPGPGVLGPDQWRARLGEFDWVILAVPATPDTEAMLGTAEIAALKGDAVVINVSRGSVVDQAALTQALQQGRIGGALLDVTTPEPLPSDHPLWELENTQITMHLSGPAQTHAFQRAADRFLDNLDRYRRGEALTPMVDYALGY